MRGVAIRASKPKQGYRALVEHDEPDGRQPDDRCDGNDDPDENPQPGTHAAQSRPGRNGENHHCSQDNQKGNGANLPPHAPSLAITEGGPALRLYNFRPRLTQLPA